MEIRNAYRATARERPMLLTDTQSAAQIADLLKQVRDLTDQLETTRTQLTGAQAALRAEREAKTAEMMLKEMGIERRDIRQVMEAVGRVWDVTSVQMTGAGRAQSMTRPRFACYHLARKYCSQMSLPQIARVFNRDHTTILHGVRQAAKLVTNDPAFRAKYEAAKAILASGVSNG